MKLARSALVGSFVYGALTVLWLAVVRPSATPAIVAWTLLLCLGGLLLSGIANQISLARGYLAAPAFFYSSGGRTADLAVAALLVGLAGLTDLVDGTVARHFERPTRVGGALDPVVDGLFFGSVAVGLSSVSGFPTWLAGVIVLRYLTPTVIGAALLAEGRSPRLSHTALGQAATVAIAAGLGAAVVVRASGPDPRFVVDAAAVLIPALTLTAFGHLFWANREAFFPSGPPAPG